MRTQKRLGSRASANVAYADKNDMRHNIASLIEYCKSVISLAQGLKPLAIKTRQKHGASVPSARGKDKKMMP